MVSNIRNLFVSVMIIVLTCLALGIVSFAAEADETVESQVEAVFQWTVTDEDKKTAKITSVNTDVTGELVIPAVIEEYTVTSIEKNAFRDCVAVTSVEFNADIESVPSGLFYGCTSLKSITFNSKIPAIGSNMFYKCTSLTDFVVPTSVESIGSYAFYGCTALKNVTLNEGLVSLGHNAFGGCTQITDILIPSTVTSISTRVFYQCSSLEKIEVAEGNTHYVADEVGVLYPSDYSTVLQYPYASSVTEYEIANGVTSIANGDFTGCNNLKSLIIPDSVTSVAMNTFKQSTIENLVIGSGLTTVGNYAFSESALQSVVIKAVVDDWGTDVFRGCANLETVVFEGDVTFIPDSMFNSCSSLTSVTGLENLQEIDWYAFWSCSSLETIDTGDKLTAIGYQAFLGCSMLTEFPFGNSITRIDSGAFMNCSGLSGGLVLPETLTTLGSNAFLGCKGITSVTFPESMTSLSSGIFTGCSGITQLLIPGNIKSIGDSCFSGITLDSLILEEGVEEIGTSAFNDSSLADIQLPSTIKTIGRAAFENHRDTEIIIPAGVESIGSMAFNGKVTYTVYVYSADCVYDENKCPYNKNSYYSTVTVYGYQGSTTESYIASCPTLDGEYHNHIYYDMCADAGLHAVAVECSDITTCIYCLETISGHTDENSDLICDNCGASTELPEYVPSCSLSFKNGVLTIAGTEILDGDYKELLAEYSAETQSLVISDGFVSIGADVFDGFNNLKMIYIPSSLTLIDGGAFSNCPSLRNIVCMSASLDVKQDTFDSDASFNLFIPYGASAVWAENFSSVNTLTFSFADGTLNFYGSLAADLYDLFDIVTMFTLNGNIIMRLHFEKFEAVDFTVFEYNTETYEGLDQTEFENVTFSVHAFVEGQFTRISFNEMYALSAEGYEDVFYMTTETEKESVVYDDTQLTIVDSIREFMNRILSAIVQLLNKLFSFFSRFKR